MKLFSHLIQELCSVYQEIKSGVGFHMGRYVCENQYSLFFCELSNNKSFCVFKRQVRVDRGLGKYRNLLKVLIVLQYKYKSRVVCKAFVCKQVLVRNMTREIIGKEGLASMKRKYHDNYEALVRLTMATYFL